jgi:hypothetical protein
MIVDSVNKQVRTTFLALPICALKHDKKNVQTLAQYSFNFGSVQEVHGKVLTKPLKTLLIAREMQIIQGICQTIYNTFG